MKPFTSSLWKATLPPRRCIRHRWSGAFTTASRFVAAFSLAITTCSSLAWADEPNSPTPASKAPADERGASVDKANVQQKQRAQSLFQKGDAAFDVQDYEEALDHFQASFAAVASPNSRLMIARSLLELGRLDEAYDEYAGVVKDAEGTKRYQEAGATAEREQEALQHRLAWLSIRRGNVPPEAALEINGRPREPELLEGEQIAVNPGRTLVRASTNDGREALAEVHLAAGRKTAVTLEMGHTVQVGSPRPVVQSEPEDSAGEPVTEQDASHARGKLLPWAIASTAVGVVGFAGFAAFGLLSKNRFNQLEADCAAGVCPPASQNDIDQGRTYQLLANVGLGVGIAGVATGAVLLILDRKQAARSATAPLQVNVGFRSVQLRGTF